MTIKKKNWELEMMLDALQPILPHRDIAGYAAARNTRFIRDALTEFLQFKMELIEKYGEHDTDENGNVLPSISVKPDSEKFSEFMGEFNKIKDIEHEVEIMTIEYSQIIGILSGDEILKLDWMLED